MSLQTPRATDGNGNLFGGSLAPPIVYHLRYLPVPAGRNHG